jgi:hypothetical protein
MVFTITAAGGILDIGTSGIAENANIMKEGAGMPTEKPEADI